LSRAYDRIKERQKMARQVLILILVITIFVCVGLAAYFLFKDKIKPREVIFEEDFCLTDSDCLPLPSECHPLTCINKEFERNYQKPEICTMMFVEEAAYQPEDCLCLNQKCVNKNIKEPLGPSLTP
jgi:hypothetical protein